MLARDAFSEIQAAAIYNERRASGAHHRGGVPRRRYTGRMYTDGIR